jgi:hypothetical protein
MVTNGDVSVYRHELAHCNGWKHQPFDTTAVPPASVIYPYEEGRLTVYVITPDTGAMMSTISYAQYDAEIIPMYDGETIVSLCQQLWEERNISVPATAEQWNQLAGCSVQD